jgi:hypothetical protein
VFQNVADDINLIRSVDNSTKVVITARKKQGYGQILKTGRTIMPKNNPVCAEKLRVVVTMLGIKL